MMSEKRILMPLVLFLLSSSGFSQTNRLTGSPYSLFGLGVNTSSNIGKNSVLGRGGYALNSPDILNNLNPASYGTDATNSFILDIGFLVEVSDVQNSSTEENRIAGNFSSLGFAANVDDKSSFALTVTPFTDVGYSLIGIQSNIEGSFDQFTSNIFGSGALNDLKVSYGRTFLKKLRLGASFSYLFGTIDETENVIADLSLLTVEESSSYRGIRFGVGLQYDFGKRLKYGFSTNFSTSLSGLQDRQVTKALALTRSLVEDETDIELDDFLLPLEVNNGIQVNPWSNLFLNFDHSIKFWTDTDQRDNVGDFVDQNIFSVGGEYFFDKNGLKYCQRIEMRAGFYYDTGYLSVNGREINTTGYSVGLGLPLGRRSKSLLNISYTQNSRGSTSGILVEERISSINVNLSLKDIWFIKRKIN